MGNWNNTIIYCGITHKTNLKCPNCSADLKYEDDKYKFEGSCSAQNK